jgi:hypothetical protein
MLIHAINFVFFFLYILLFCSAKWDHRMRMRNVNDLVGNSRGVAGKRGVMFLMFHLQRQSKTFLALFE